jgi:hypothetical protein
MATAQVRSHKRLAANVTHNAWQEGRMRARRRKRRRRRRRRREHKSISKEK